MEEALESQENLSIPSTKESNSNEDMYRRPMPTRVRGFKDEWTYLVRTGPKHTLKDIDVRLRSTQDENWTFCHYNQF